MLRRHKLINVKVHLTGTGEVVTSWNDRVLELEAALVSMCYFFITHGETEAREISWIV